MATLTNFYVQKPQDKHWNVGMTNYVIEAGPIDINDEGLLNWQKTDEFVRDHLKVIKPENFSWPLVEKASWVECNGPARRLGFEEYFKLYHSLDPEHPLPVQ